MASSITFKTHVKHSKRALQTPFIILFDTRARINGQSETMGLRNYGSGALESSVCPAQVLEVVFSYYRAPGPLNCEVNE